MMTVIVVMAMVFGVGATGEAGILQSDGQAVRRVEIGLPPSFLHMRDFFDGGQAACGQDGLQSREPLTVVSIVTILAELGWMSSDLGAEHLHPVAPGEGAALAELHRHGEGLGLPRFGKNRIGDGIRLRYDSVGHLASPDRYAGSM